MKSFAEAVKSSPRRAGESVWLEVGEKEVRGRLEHLKHCLIGRWGSISAPLPELDLLGIGPAKLGAMVGICTLVLADVPTGSSSGKGGLRAGEEVVGSHRVACCGSQRKGVEQLGLQVEV
ncbi:hypothetical protein CK203_082203 [Vitis vinifera]|uniref:Uncharacterized protein n=1 Tax=Vitis vinifera TaxID=29760 RepID=A0A438CNA3_VITVI|nr:hypothetical protein CK203_082203 [Vitis vinifera]